MESCPGPKPHRLATPPPPHRPVPSPPGLLGLLGMRRLPAACLDSVPVLTLLEPKLAVRLDCTDLVMASIPAAPPRDFSFARPLPRPRPAAAICTDRPRGWVDSLPARLLPVPKAGLQRPFAQPRLGAEPPELNRLSPAAIWDRRWDSACAAQPAGSALPALPPTASRTRSAWGRLPVSSFPGRSAHVQAGNEAPGLGRSRDSAVLDQIDSTSEPPCSRRASASRERRWRTLPTETRRKSTSKTS